MFRWWTRSAITGLISLAIPALTSCTHATGSNPGTSKTTAISRVTATPLPAAQVLASPVPKLEKIPMRPISIGNADINLPIFFERLHEASGLNVIADGNLDGSVSSNLDGVAWSAALDYVIFKYNLVATYDENFMILNQRYTGDNKSARNRFGGDFANLPWRGNSSGEPTSLDVKDGDLVVTLRSLAKLLGRTVVLDPNIEGKISAITVSTPSDRLFEFILRSCSLEAEIFGDVIHVWNPRTVRIPETSFFQTQAPVGMASESASLECTVGFNVRDRGETSDARAEYIVRIKGDGSTQYFRFGSRVPVVTPSQMGGPATVTYVDAVASIGISARIWDGVKRSGWFTANVTYERPFNRFTLLPAKESPPFLDSINLTTVLGVEENKKTKIGGYEDEVTGRNTSIDFTWRLLSPAVVRALPFQPTLRHLLPNLSYSIGGKSIHYWLAMASDRSEHALKAGVRVPIVTQAQLGGPPTVTYLDAFVALNTRLLELVVHAKKFDSQSPHFWVDCEYSRLQDRPSATADESPYLDIIHFTGPSTVSENEEELISRGNDTLSGRFVEARFSWNWEN